MKKKFLSLVLVFTFILTGVFCLTACGGGGNNEKRHYFTISAPDHCSYNITNYNTDKGKSYILDGNTFNVTFYLEAGYEPEGDITLKVNGEVKEWTSMEDSWCEYSFTPTKDFNIVVEGTFVEQYFDVSFVGELVGDFSYEGVYIKFPDKGAQPVSAFLTSGSEYTNLRVKYGTAIEFWLYTEGYEYNPNWGGFGYAEFYHEDNKFGYHYYNEIRSTTAINFNGKSPISDAYINYSENGSTNRIESDKLEISVDLGSKTLTINLKDDSIPSEVLSALQLKINGELQSTTFTKGVNNITLKNPYEYGNAEYPYSYSIDLNFYTLSYFD